MRSSSVAASVAAHAVALLAAIIVPLFAASDLPDVRSPVETYMPAYHAGTVPAEAPSVPVSPPATRRPNAFAAPLEAPDGIREEIPFLAAGIDRSAPGGLDLEAAPGLPPDFGTREVDATLPPPPPPPRPASPLRLGGQIKAPRRLDYAAPVYPPIAQSAGVEGLVILEATIGVDGRVQNLQVLRSHPLLDGAAIDAVRQWRYRPTLLNGVPVPIVMTVTVDFRLTK